MNNKHALVCGSSKGIGASTAIELSKLGATITLLARDKDSLSNVLDCLDTSKNQNHNFIIADFDDPFKLKDTIDQHIINNPTIHILINNSGGPKPGPIVDANVEDFISAFNRHLICNHILVQAVVPKMKEARFGRIINITSISGLMGNPGQVNYSSSKAALTGFTKSLAKEVGSRNITVNSVAPGYIETDMTSFLEDETRMNIIKNIPLGRIGKVDDVSELVMFLASDEASYITGQTISVDGGLLMY